MYEPAVAVLDGHARETSRAAEPEIARAGELCFHRICFEREVREDALPR